VFRAVSDLQAFTVRFCLILMVVMPAFAASPEPAATVVRADRKSGRLVRTMVPMVVRTVVPVVSIPASPKVVEPVVIAALPPATASPLDSPPLTSPPAAESSSLTELVSRIAGEMGVEEALVHSVIRAESNYNTRAVSPKGAQGLMQLIPSTARRFGVTNVFDAAENIQGGARYLKFLLDYYQNDYPKAIAAYNAGEGAVDKYHGIPPYPETQNYVYRVAKNLKTARQAKAHSPEPSTRLVAAALPDGKPETYNPIRTSVGEDGRVYYRTP
jgi:soluble lytic murein transglycosylase-like protein